MAPEKYALWYAGLILASCVVGSTLVELCSLRHLSKVIINLCNALSPGTPHISIQSYNFFMVHLHLLLPSYRLCLAEFCQNMSRDNFLEPCYAMVNSVPDSLESLHGIAEANVHGHLCITWVGLEFLVEKMFVCTWMQVFIATVVDNFLYPVSAIYSHVFQHIDWAGVQYWLQNGKICQVTTLVVCSVSRYCFQCFCNPIDMHCARLQFLWMYKRKDISYAGTGELFSFHECCHKHFRSHHGVP